MEGSEIITQQKLVPAVTPDAGNNLSQWIFERTKSFITGNAVEIDNGSGQIATNCLQCNATMHVLPINLADPSFDISYTELGDFDTLIALHIAEQIVNNPLLISNCTKLLKEGGHLITRLPAYTALYNGLNQGFKYWKQYNREFISKIIGKHFSIIKIRYFMVVNELASHHYTGNYSEQVHLFRDGNAGGFNHTGISTIVVGKKR